MKGNWLLYCWLWMPHLLHVANSLICFHYDGDSPTATGTARACRDSAHYCVHWRVVIGTYLSRQLKYHRGCAIQGYCSSREFKLDTLPQACYECSTSSCNNVELQRRNICHEYSGDSPTDPGYLKACSKVCAKYVTTTSAMKNVYQRRCVDRNFCTSPHPRRIGCHTCPTSRCNYDPFLFCQSYWGSSTTDLGRSILCLTGKKYCLQEKGQSIGARDSIRISRMCTSDRRQCDKSPPASRCRVCSAQNCNKAAFTSRKLANCSQYSGSLYNEIGISGQCAAFNHHCAQYITKIGPLNYKYHRLCAPEDFCIGKPMTSECKLCATENCNTGSFSRTPFIRCRSYSGSSSTNTGVQIRCSQDSHLCVQEISLSRTGAALGTLQYVYLRKCAPVNYCTGKLKAKQCTECSTTDCNNLPFKPAEHLFCYGTSGYKHNEIGSSHKCVDVNHVCVQYQIQERPATGPIKYRYIRTCKVRNFCSGKPPDQQCLECSVSNCNRAHFSLMTTVLSTATPTPRPTDVPSTTGISGTSTDSGSTTPSVPPSTEAPISVESCHQYSGSSKSDLGNRTACVGSNSRCVQEKVPADNNSEFRYVFHRNCSHQGYCNEKPQAASCVECSTDNCNNQTFAVHALLCYVHSSSSVAQTGTAVACANPKLRCGKYVTRAGIGMAAIDTFHRKCVPHNFCNSPGRTDVLAGGCSVCSANKCNRDPFIQGVCFQYLGTDLNDIGRTVQCENSSHCYQLLRTDENGQTVVARGCTASEQECEDKPGIDECSLCSKPMCNDAEFGSSVSGFHQADKSTICLLGFTVSLLSAKVNGI